MTGEHLEAILKVAGAKSEKDGWLNLPEGATHDPARRPRRRGHDHLAHRGASSRTESSSTRATRKRELFAVVRADVYAVAFEGEAAGGQGRPSRRIRLRARPMP